MFLICVGSDWEKQHVFWVVYLAFHVACVHNYLTFPMLWAGDYWQYSLNIAESFHLSLANTQRIVHLTCPAEPCKNIFFQIFILDITIYCTDTCITAYTCTSLLQIDSVHMVYPPTAGILIYTRLQKLRMWRIAACIQALYTDILKLTDSFYFWKNMYYAQHIFTLFKLT